MYVYVMYACWDTKYEKLMERGSGSEGGGELRDPGKQVQWSGKVSGTESELCLFWR